MNTTSLESLPNDKVDEIVALLRKKVESAEGWEWELSVHGSNNTNEHFSDPKTVGIEGKQGKDFKVGVYLVAPWTITTHFWFTVGGKDYECEEAMAENMPNLTAVCKLLKAAAEAINADNKARQKQAAKKSEDDWKKRQAGLAEDAIAALKASL